MSFSSVLLADLYIHEAACYGHSILLATPVEGSPPCWFMLGLMVKITHELQISSFFLSGNGQDLIKRLQPYNKTQRDEVLRK